MMRCAALLFPLFLLLTTVADVAHAQEAAPVDKVRTSVMALAPAGVYVTAVNVSSKRVLVRGTSQNASQVSQFLRAIDGASGVSALNLVTLEAAATGQTFSLQFDVDCSAADSLCTTPKAKTSTVYKCEIGGKLVFQDRPCAAK